jgi:hypothetical protein
VTTTSSPTNSAAYTSTFTVTAVPATFTSTPTPTPLGNKGLVIYPNPVTGPSVNLLPPAYVGSQNVRVEIFTLSFRKVLDKTFPNVPSGTPINLPLADSFGHPLANGLYYAVVTVGGEHSIGKLLVLK